MITNENSLDDEKNYGLLTDYDLLDVYTSNNTIIDKLKAIYKCFRFNSVTTKSHKDIILYKSLSTFLGECEKQSKEKDYIYSDELIIKNIEKFVKNLNTIKTEDSKLEIEFFNLFLPTKLSYKQTEEYIDKLLLDMDKSNKNKCIGFIMGSIVKSYPGMVDTQLVMKILNSKI